MGKQSRRRANRPERPSVVDRESRHRDVPSIRDIVNGSRLAFEQFPHTVKSNRDRIALFINYFDGHKQHFFAKYDVSLYSADDHTLWKRIRSNKEEPAVLRAGATLCLSGLYIDFSALEIAFRYATQAMTICESASDEEKNISLDMRSGGYGTVGSFLARLQELCAAIRKSGLAQCFATPSGAVLMVRGEGCDAGCGTWGPVEHKCSRCKITYYCSAECARDDWHNYHHRQLCRKKGEYKEGDLVQTKPVFPLGRESNLGRLITRKANPNGEEREWWVEIPAGFTEADVEERLQRCFVLEEKEFHRTRPVLATCFGPEQMMELREMLIAERDSREESEESQQLFHPPQLVGTVDEEDSDLE